MSCRYVSAALWAGYALFLASQSLLGSRLTSSSKGPSPAGRARVWVGFISRLESRGFRSWRSAPRRQPRYVLAAAAAIVLPASIVAAASVSQHTDHSASRTALRSTVGGAGGASGGLPQPGPVMPAVALVAPRGAFNRILSAQQAETAAQACAGMPPTRDGRTTPGTRPGDRQRYLRRRIRRAAHRLLLQPDPPGRLLPAGGLLGHVRPGALANRQPGLDQHHQYLRVHGQMQRGRRVPHQ